MDVLVRLSDLGYLVAAGLFIVGLKLLSSHRTAPRGNRLGALGMLIAVVVTLVKMGGERGILSWELILGGLVLGGLIGAVMAKRVRMTGMPEMVALFNGFGGGASALVALAEMSRAAIPANPVEHLGSAVFLVAIGASTLIGWGTFMGSLIAMLKLSGTLRKNLTLPGLNAFKGLLAIGCLSLIGLLLHSPTHPWILYSLVALSCILGIVFVMPIGGADMPVVISFLNSLSGVAASATGFVVNNNALIIGGSLVGAAGLILTTIMCRAMNRSFVDVMLKAYGAATGSGAKKQDVKGYEAEEAALAFDGARNVVIVPGYGMAVSQAQHVLREISEELAKKGTEVRFAIHPVAGRMPGHMNVLLAEANVPYEQLYELDDINSHFTATDVALVVGANDIINPAAHTDPAGPLGGMPILQVEKARTVIIVKRSLSPGYAGVDNELFYRPSTMMLFGDAKAKLTELLAALKEL